MAAGSRQHKAAGSSRTPCKFAVGFLAVHQVLPELLGHSAVVAILALRLVVLALCAVPQKEQPALLLQDLLLTRIAIDR
jgi:hypothetical protein